MSDYRYLHNQHVESRGSVDHRLNAFSVFFPGWIDADTLSVREAAQHGAVRRARLPLPVRTVAAVVGRVAGETSVTIVEDVDPLECESCHYPTPKLKSFRRTGMSDDRDRVQLCWLCSASFISSQHCYPSLHSPENRDVLQAIGFATNAILDAMGKLRDPNEGSE